MFVSPIPTYLGVVAIVSVAVNAQDQHNKVAKIIMIQKIMGMWHSIGGDLRGTLIESQMASLSDKLVAIKYFPAICYEKF